ncbi:MAG: 4Fe-4S dicluster domain-containing protein [Elusimicrobiota bacterium]|jgi:ferredoxin
MQSSMLDPETLIRLIDRLDQYPVGLPDAPDIREFLSLFLSQEEAQLAAAFPLKEATSLELSKILHWPMERTDRVLEGLAQKGAVLDFPLGEKNFWMLSPSVTGFVEFSLMKLHPGIPAQRMAELLDRYTSEHLWKEVFGSKTPLGRTLVGADIPVTSRAATYAEVETVVLESQGGALQTCYCRHKEHLLGRTCKLASWENTCISLGTAADFVVRRGFGRKAEVPELLSVVRELGKKGLIHVTDNVRQKPSFICNCCGCCCGLLSGILTKGIEHSVAPSPYLLHAEPGLCAGCGLCVKTCQIQALSLEDGRARVKEERCLGCGACLRTCRKAALNLRRRQRTPNVPYNSVTKYVRITWEKGRFFSFLKKTLAARLS